jgi:hypothetical protein
MAYICCLKIEVELSSFSGVPCEIKLTFNFLG